MKPDHRSAKPSYTLSRRQLWASFWLAWLANAFILVGAIVYRSAEAVALAPIITPSTFLLIAGMLGIHRFAGAQDFRAAAEMASSSPPYNPRDEPSGSGEVQ
ncbi:NAD(P)+ transhydrogenase beta chain [Rhizobium leguminosarum]|uniref:NAD(P)+ transhydrogenase beta chain n=1 Tax=Rhizobium leguminosarum TaxID=384 RepID=UPI00140FB8FE|nr:NAD(P)+ transhydrogenase beta chain [Rhizobium leguminosarum]QIO60674.1 NAD(P)+ transhydrogenase beta chain [Rhizobium leguminosarum bv. trifolii]